jgi:hypothetical protein
MGTAWHVLDVPIEWGRRMTSPVGGSHFRAQLDQPLGLPARSGREPLGEPGLEGLEDLPTSVSGEAELLELSSKACAAATSLLDPVRWASVTTAFDARPVTVAVTELRALLFDHTQYCEEEGPALQAVRTGSRVYATAGPERPRWARLRVIADALGVRWAMALPLRAGGGWVGSLNLYGTEPLENPDGLDARAVSALVGAPGARLRVLSGRRQPGLLGRLTGAAMVGPVRPGEVGARHGRVTAEG